MRDDTKRIMERELTPGERLLWHGRAQQGLRLTRGDLFAIPFSLIWTGFAIYWEISVLREGASALFAMAGVPILLAGLYVLIGRFFFDAWRRGHLHYGVTDQRVLIATSGLGGTVTHLDLASLGAVTFRERGLRRGNIVFGSGPTSNTDLYGALAEAGWPGVTKYRLPMFEGIDEARRVYKTLMDARAAAIRGAGG